MYSHVYKQAAQTQNYEQIRAHCLRGGSLFEDPEFPADNRSVFGVKGSNIRYSGSIVWRRPVELVGSGAQFIADGVSRHDVIQGELGNCWFIAAVANLTLHPGLFTQVIPNQSFRQGDYCGAFQFRFWQYGAWTSVLIDDRLPCDKYGKLLFLHSSDRREFWSALLEKAYAKLHGSYSSLSGGSPSEALQDFSGGIIEMIDLDESANTGLYHVLKKAYERHSLINCVLTGRQGYHEERTNSGLVRGHAYSLTSVQEIPVARRGGLVRLVRIRNPWGDHFEWNGDWSDRSSCWDGVDSSIKGQLGLSRSNDGEFWMSIQDFQQHFSRVDICHVSPDPVDNDAGRLDYLPWKKEFVEGCWARGRSAGGCFNYSSFETNPQYFFHFKASAADGDADKCTVIVSLLQRLYGRDGRLSIGFRIFKVPSGSSNTKLDMSTMRRCKAVSSGSFTNSREVSARFELSGGDYCIVPSTYEPGEEGEFLLRVFSEPESGRHQFPPYQYQPQQQPYAQPPIQQHYAPQQPYGAPIPPPQLPYSAQVPYYPPQQPLTYQQQMPPYQPQMQYPLPPVAPQMNNSQNCPYPMGGTPGGGVAPPPLPATMNNNQQTPSYGSVPAPQPAYNPYAYPTTTGGAPQSTPSPYPPANPFPQAPPSRPAQAGFGFEPWLSR